jgi:hypothetical protein
MPAVTELLRRIAIGVASGAVAGLVAGGIGGRLFMSLLAALNPEAAGIRSDDDFIIGQVTLQGTVNLLVLTTVLGAVGGLVWVAIRGLRFGPRWWRLVSMPLGVGAVAGSSLVHSEGVDFTVLEPTVLAVALTLAVPVLAATLVSAVGDRWIGSEQTVWQLLPAAVPWAARAGFAALALVAANSLLADLRVIL